MSVMEKELNRLRRLQDSRANDLAETQEALKLCGDKMPVTRKCLLQKEARQKMAVAEALNMIDELESQTGALPLRQKKDK